ncbi:MAG TPA: helix-turn-helix domain-containing protein [Nitrososphaera sp.]|nr:helix-turn-helix domain-containing protein [Nitrososphaera sp.]
MGSKIDTVKMAFPISDIHDKLVSALEQLGLRYNEVQVLLCLITHGKLSAKDVHHYTGIPKTETYNFLSKLMARGIVFSTLDRPQMYFALSINEIIDLLIRTRKNMIRTLSVKDYSNIIDSLRKNIAFQSYETYDMLFGKNSVTKKIKMMLAKAMEEVIVMINAETLVRFYSTDILDQLIQLTTKGVHVKFLTSCSNSDYLGITDNDGTISFKTISRVGANFLMVDAREMLHIFTNQKKSKLCAFYLNDRSISSLFKFVFGNTV